MYRTQLSVRNISIHCNFTLSTEPEGWNVHWIIYTVFMGLTIMFITCGNFIVLLAFRMESKFRKAMNYPLISLAVSDMLIGLLSLPMGCQYFIFRRGLLSKPLCVLWLVLDFASCLINLANVYLININRFLLAVAPGSYKLWRSERQMKILLGVIWVVPLPVSAAVVLSSSNTDCSFQANKICIIGHFHEPLGAVLLASLMCFIPLLILFYINSVLFAATTSLSWSYKDNILISTATNKYVQSAVPAYLLSNRKVVKFLVSPKRSLDSDSSSDIEDVVKSIPGTRRGTSGDLPKSIPGTRRGTIDIFTQCISSKPSSSQVDKVLPGVPLNSKSGISTTSMEKDNNNNNAKKKTPKKGEKEVKDTQKEVKDKRGLFSAKTRARLILIVAVFSICYLPYSCLYVYDTVRPGNVNEEVYFIAYLWSYTISIFNPICYTFPNMSFEKAFLRLIKFDFRKK